MGYTNLDDLLEDTLRKFAEIHALAVLGKNLYRATESDSHAERFIRFNVKDLEGEEYEDAIREWYAIYRAYCREEKQKLQGEYGTS